MSTRLVILGFLKDRPLYGYELKQEIEKHMGDWTSIAFGSIYFALNKMAKEGLVKKAATEQEGSRPSRTIYEITESGRAEFEKLLHQVWYADDRQYYDFDIGLFFLHSLPREEVHKAMKERISGLEKTLQYLHLHEEKQFENPNVPRLAEAIFSHTAAHLQAELEWMQQVLKNLKAGIYD